MGKRVGTLELELSKLFTPRRRGTGPSTPERTTTSKEDGKMATPKKKVTSLKTAKAKAKRARAKKVAAKPKRQELTAAQKKERSDKRAKEAAANRAALGKTRQARREARMQVLEVCSKRYWSVVKGGEVFKQEATFKALAETPSLVKAAAATDVEFHRDDWRHLGVRCLRGFIRQGAMTQDRSAKPTTCQAVAGAKPTFGLVSRTRKEGSKARRKTTKRTAPSSKDAKAKAARAKVARAKAKAKASEGQEQGQEQGQEEVQASA